MKAFTMVMKVINVFGTHDKAMYNENKYIFAEQVTEGNIYLFCEREKKSVEIRVVGLLSKDLMDLYIPEVEVGTVEEPYL